MKNKIIVCYHKPFKIFKNDILEPIQVGAEISDKIIEGISGDNSGDNISSKNASYCELTGLYWLWKNVEADNYGLFHYRRFLDFKNKYQKETSACDINSEDWDNQTLSELMQDYDIILPKKSKFNLTAYKRYAKFHIIEDLDIVIDIIKSDYPQYVKAMETAMNSKEEYSCNLFVMKKEIFNEYCEWMFDILKKAEDKIDYRRRKDYQIRVFGFISERMMRIFIEHKLETCPNLKIKHVRVINIQEEPVRKINFLIGNYVKYPTKSVLTVFGIKIKRKIGD